ncbi:MAG: HAD hydrolase-like protein [Kaiparowitsia implicata GSE-PSE-MK54-09C]|jgi:phosphoglycolate phosphatase-like HAD superfamily hydrolase|nr:HAD hydrolase-like protein [Kaiparowitsia implicata GSE-PSE-MK54-09C]
MAIAAAISLALVPSLFASARVSRQRLPAIKPHSASPQLTVFCDFDGPIVDVSDRYYQTYQLAIADVCEHYHRQGIVLAPRLLSKAQFWQMKQNRIPDVEIALESGLLPEQVECFLQQVTTIVNQPTLLHQDCLQPGVRWALSLLHSQGARLILVTLRCQEQAQSILQSYGLADLFTDIRGTGDRTAAYLNQADTKAALLRQVVADHTISRAELDAAWMVGDTEADVLSGRSLNISTIALTCGIRSATYLNQFQPCRIHSDLLSTAHYLVYQRELHQAVC